MPIDKKTEYTITLPETLKQLLETPLVFSEKGLREFHRTYKAFGEELDSVVGIIEFPKPERCTDEAKLFSKVLQWAKEHNKPFYVKEVMVYLERSESNTSQLLLRMTKAKLLLRERVDSAFRYELPPGQIVIQQS